MQALGVVGLLCRRLVQVRLDFCAGLGEVRLLCRHLVRLDFCAGTW